jgi:hypothetical protein
LLEKPMSGMPAERATLPAALTWSALSGPRMRLAPSATAWLAAVAAPCADGPVSLITSVMLSAMLGLEATKSMARMAPFCIEVATLPSATSPLSGSSMATRTGPLPMVWPLTAGATGAAGPPKRGRLKSKLEQPDKVRSDRPPTSACLRVTVSPVKSN